MLKVDLKEIEHSDRAMVQAFSHVIESVVDAFEQKTLSRNEIIRRVDRMVDALETLESSGVSTPRPDIQRYVFRTVARKLCGANRQDGLRGVSFLPDKDE